MLAIRGLFKGGEVILLEEAAVTEQCNVIVVFKVSNRTGAVTEALSLGLLKV